MKARIAEPEFSRPYAIEKIPAHGVTEILEPKEDERKKLAERFGLLELPMLRAELNIKSARAESVFEVVGKLVADVVQQCVVTLEPLPVHIEHDISVIYAPPEELEIEGTGPADPDEEEMEPIIDGTIDLGELVAQNLGVALDPYPRKPGLAPVEAEYGDKEAGRSPLAELASWSKKPKDSR